MSSPSYSVLYWPFVLPCRFEVKSIETCPFSNYLLSSSVKLQRKICLFKFTGNSLVVQCLWLCFHCQGPRFSPWSGNWGLASHMAYPPNLQYFCYNAYFVVLGNYLQVFPTIVYISWGCFICDSHCATWVIYLCSEWILTEESCRFSVLETLRPLWP